MFWKHYEIVVNYANGEQWTWESQNISEKIAMDNLKYMLKEKGIEWTSMWIRRAD